MEMFNEFNRWGLIYIWNECMSFSFRKKNKKHMEWNKNSNKQNCKKMKSILNLRVDNVGVKFSFQKLMKDGNVLALEKKKKCNKENYIEKIINKDW